ncbi:hypothetical protein KPH14_012595 [Odynerus spinipes]|uniref:Endonuclease/exonuclease/phosphatase domain-containing protein n=1 Tax=Odynerus spinipes TaxID=1348599 RepID=A0AAD9VLJ0_9HYME|nr:hypothetical protein KPH14_012595 [Odynerus spinipes]
MVTKPSSKAGCRVNFNPIVKITDIAKIDSALAKRVSAAIASPPHARNPCVRAVPPRGAVAAPPQSPPNMTSSETTTPANVIVATGVRVLQLNLGRSDTATGEVRQLISKKRLDVLLLQEPYVQKRAKGYAFVGFGTAMWMAAVRSKHPWAAVAVCNPAFQMIFVSQLSTPHCVCAEVQAPGFSFYVVSHFFKTGTTSRSISDTSRWCSVL